MFTLLRVVWGWQALETGRPVVGQPRCRMLEFFCCWLTFIFCIPVCLLLAPRGVGVCVFQLPSMQKLLPFNPLG